MAILKYKGPDGNFKPLANILVKGIDVVQTSGASSADVMSQSAVTEFVGDVNNALTAHTSNTDIHLTQEEKSILDSISGSVGTMAYENTSSYSSATEVNAALGNKANTASTLGGYGITDAYTKSETSGATEISTALEGKLDVTAYTPTDLSNYYTKSETSGATELTTALGNKANTSDLDNFFDDAKYEDSGTTKVINFYHGNTIKATIDASDFIVDGMVDDVRIENGYLVIDFNTASGKQDISIPLTDIFDPSNYYTKSETSGATELTTAFSAKVDSSTFTAHTASTVHMNGTEKTNLDSLATNIAAISGITSTNVGNWNNAASNSHSHTNKTALDSITSAVGTMAYQNATSYSSATQVNTALSNKANVSDTVTATTSADYVKMVTTGGAEVKITKASFVEAMAEILNNADKGANVNKVTVTGTDGKFGTVNLTNLASLLGVNKQLNAHVSFIQFNPINDTVPSDYQEGIGLDIKRVEEGVRFQIALFYKGTIYRNLFYRHSWAAEPIWSEWIEL